MMARYLTKSDKQSHQSTRPVESNNASLCNIQKAANLLVTLARISRKHSRKQRRIMYPDVYYRPQAVHLLGALADNHNFEGAVYTHALSLKCEPLLRD